MATVSMPRSRHAWMMRTAISPRLAIRTRSNGRPSLCKDGSWSAPASERDVAMLLPGIDVALVGQHRQRPDESRAGLGRPDDVVDVAAARGDVRIGNLGLVGVGEPRSLR